MLFNSYIALLFQLHTGNSPLHTRTSLLLRRIAIRWFCLPRQTEGEGEARRGEGVQNFLRFSQEAMEEVRTRVLLAKLQELEGGEVEVASKIREATVFCLRNAQVTWVRSLLKPYHSSKF